MKDRKQIRKIAKAIFNAAQEAESVTKTGDSLNVVAQILEHNPEILRFFRDIFQPEEHHQKVLSTLTQKAKIDDLAKAYLTHLLQIRQIDWLPQIAEYYQRLADNYLGQERALVTTPYPLSKSERKSLVAILNSLTGKKVSLQEEINSSLLAGISVRMGSMIFDGTLSNQLRRIEKEICNAS